ncbi:MAG: glycosyltransferase family A protein [Chthoniobacterales bacterium]
MNPTLSVIVIVHDMRREAPRTLFSLSPGYQHGVAADDYEVIVVENGSSDPLSADEVERIAPNFRYLRHETSSSSPVEAVNLGVELARGEHVAVCVDGARILSPGIVRYLLAAFRAFPNPFVYTLGWHLGEEVQNLSIKKGYDQAAEDRLLDSIEWQSNGYALFSVSALALSCREGWFSTVAESNCFALRKTEFVRLGGFDVGFQAPGGGLVNLDFFSLASSASELTPVLLLGEGTFHQIHGGVATNVEMAEHPWEKFHEEYVRLRGKAYAPPQFTPHYLGRLSPEARRFLPQQP